MKWISELLGINEAHSAGPDEQALERVIEGTEPKLRLVAGYKKKLLPAVRVALAHIDATVEQIPGPLAVSRKTFSSDPRVNAFFASADEIGEVFGRSEELRNFFAEIRHGDARESWALLCTNKQEKSVLGSELMGDDVRRDVLQTAINFYDHKVLSPAACEDDVRTGIKQCIFDGLITYALQHILELKSQRQDLEDQHRVLHARLRARQARGGGLSALMAAAKEEVDSGEGLEEALSDAQQRLQALPARQNLLAHYLDEISTILTHPEEFIHMNVACFRLTDMGIKVDGDSQQSTNTVCFSELEVAKVLRRVVVLVRYPREEMAVPKDGTLGKPQDVHPSSQP